MLVRHHGLAGFTPCRVTSALFRVCHPSRPGFIGRQGQGRATGITAPSSPHPVAASGPALVTQGSAEEADYWRRLKDLKQSGADVTVTVKEVIPKGVIVMYGQPPCQGFIHLEMCGTLLQGGGEDLVGREVTVKVASVLVRRKQLKFKAADCVPRTRGQALEGSSTLEVMQEKRRHAKEMWEKKTRSQAEEEAVAAVGVSPAPLTRGAARAAKPARLQLKKTAAASPDETVSASLVTTSAASSEKSGAASSEKRGAASANETVAAAPKKTVAAALKKTVSVSPEKMVAAAAEAPAAVTPPPPAVTKPARSRPQKRAALVVVGAGAGAGAGATPEDGASAKATPDKTAPLRPRFPAGAIDAFKAGQLASGVVRRVTKRGVFVELDGSGVVGQLRISEFSGQVVTSLSDHLVVGQELKVIVLIVNAARERLLLSCKRLEPSPGDMVHNPQAVLDGADLTAARHAAAAAKLSAAVSAFQVGQVLTGQVLSIALYGVFVDLGGTVGLVHLTEFSSKRIARASMGEYIAVGQQVKVLVIAAHSDTGRVQLSLRQLEPSPGAFLTDPQLVFDRAEETAERWRLTHPTHAAKAGADQATGSSSSAQMVLAP